MSAPLLCWFQESERSHFGSLGIMKTVLCNRIMSRNQIRFYQMGSSNGEANTSAALQVPWHTDSLLTEHSSP